MWSVVETGEETFDSKIWPIILFVAAELFDSRSPSLSNFRIRMFSQIVCTSCSWPGRFRLHGADNDSSPNERQKMGRKGSSNQPVSVYSA